MAETNDPPIGDSLGWTPKEISTLSHISKPDIEASRQLVNELSPDGLAPLIDPEGQNNG